MTEDALGSKPAELKPLTSIRGVAAWFVVLYHIRLGAQSYLPEPLMALFSKGYLAVDFFFILSGFVMWLTYGRRIVADGFAFFPRFMGRRLARIWPLHAFILLGCIVLATALWVTGNADNQRYPFAELPLHILLMQNWGFTSALSWNDPSWSISTELGAYVAFPFLAFGLRPDRHRAGLLVFMLLAVAALLFGYFQLHGHQNLGADISGEGFVRCVLQFAMGMLICALWLLWRAGPRWLSPMLAAIGLMLGGLFVAGVASETALIPLSFGALLLSLALTAEQPNHPLNWQPIYYLGEISYSTYLGHFMLYVLFKLLFVSDPFSVRPALAALYLLLVFVTSVGLYHCVEKPAQRKLNAMMG